ncbi:hypothetical protein FIBSPDRAFT_910314 [Athelia psychrophila]|uniref:Uncharacterized protein n=1 Tax=Athelia psychrophila TaxID=1759441 RepID=A0A166LN55_9AGAM|nr:hypothetical protein FIBSPDRAFT_910314 [Fibularhizoctonia sp. CBS 109695]
MAVRRLSTANHTPQVGSLPGLQNKIHLFWPKLFAACILGLDLSVYPCATVNFGPVTCTFDHVDPANLPFGLCAVTALGDFDHTRGGHLVLWDLKLIIEFPAGSTALLPSAYTAGGLFRWVDQGMQPTAAYMESLSREDWEAEMERSAARWQEGVRLYSTLTSLQQPADLN